MEQYIIANCTDVGVARQVNEDSMVTFDSPNGRVAAVCDGMGGQAAGDIASQLAGSIIRDKLENNTFNTPAEAITTAIMAANQGILHRASQNPDLAGMGATCVMVIVRDGIVHYGWVGDSRIYYIANHIIRQISKDQSYVQQLVDCGEITPEEAEHHPQKNEILNALGVPGMTPPVIGTPLRPEPGSVVLLCSDGLSGMVDNTHIERTVSNKTLPLHDRAAKLVAQANANGGLDNITVQLIEFKGSGAASPISASGKTQKLPLTLIAGIITALIVAAISLWFIFGANNGKKSPEMEGIKTEDKRTPG
ncbi:MAG: Stp1/IreP family PP2C-type Ser/Thr phosphatase, partial [Duncaniella sp.]|nr:Stp1/IreP family PP2C-type Ser/Thr phosphatase [Duncaniella sp.]